MLFLKKKKKTAEKAWVSEPTWVVKDLILAYLAPGKSFYVAGKHGPAAWRIPVQSAAVTSGELYHSSLKNMQIVMWDYFLCQIFFLDPIRGRSTSYLPANSCNKVQ